MTNQHLMVYCTCPDRDTATRIASALVERRQAACANIVPGLVSIYRWEGAVQQDGEELLLIKTTADAYEAVEASILELHPYELPEVIAVPLVRGLAGYLAWVREETAGKAE